MSHGSAYVLDEDGSFSHKYNPELVTIQRVVETEDEASLRSLVEEHVAATGSPRARAILEDWSRHLASFWKVVPILTPLKVDGHLAVEAPAAAP
jgi:glutamate synthase (ferredoxin)